MSSMTSRLAMRVSMRGYRHKLHAGVGVPRYAEGLFYPLPSFHRVPHKTEGRLHVPHASRHPRTRATGDGTPASQASTYDPVLLLANPRGFLVTVQSAAGGKSEERTRRAVQEARALLTSVKNPPTTLGVPLTQCVGHETDSIALHPGGEFGCAYLPLHVSDAAAKTPFPVGNPVVSLAAAAVDAFAQPPFAPNNTPEYLARLIPVETVCHATEDDIVRAVRDILPQSFGVLSKPVSRTSTKSLSYDVKYAHFGKSPIDRESLIEKIDRLIPEGPDFDKDANDPDNAITVHVFHDVALIGVLPRWKALRGYNPSEALSVATTLAHDAQLGGTHDTVVTTGGEGYP